MLDIAVDRLAPFPQVTIYQQNVVTLSLDQRFDLAFSYGGVWYFVPSDDGFAMISHIRDDEANAEGLERLADHVVIGGTLLLGVQAPHHDYTAPIADGLRYSQRITPIEDGFRKDYRLDDDGRPVMEQTTDYRTYGFEEAVELLDKAGFDYRPRTAARPPHAPLPGVHATMKIGFIGTGSMGNPVAERLMSAGHELFVHDAAPGGDRQSRRGRSYLVRRSGRSAVRVDAVLLSLPSHVEVEDVCFGVDGLLTTIRPGTFLIDLTTVSISLVPRLVQTRSTHSVRYLSAPVSQGVDNARLGRLSVFLGGDVEDVEACLAAVRRGGDHRRSHR